MFTRTFTLHIFALIISIASMQAFAQDNKAGKKATPEQLEQIRKNAQHAQSSYLADLASQQIQKGDAATAAQLALEGLPDKHSSDLAMRIRPFHSTAHVYLNKAIRLQREYMLIDSHDDQQSRITYNATYGVTFSPDGKILATGSESGTIMLHNAATGKLIRTL